MNHTLHRAYKTLDQPYEGRNQQEERIRLGSLGKGGFNNVLKLKKKKKRQRNTAQVKEQLRDAQVQINEEEIGKLPEKQFRIIKAKMIQNVENRTEKMQESISKDLEEIKNKHRETSNTITETKNTPEGINSRISEAEE